MTKDSIKQMIKISFVTSLALGLFSTLTENQTVKAESNSVTRIQGDNRFETASLISEESYSSSDTVIIANAREFADALTGVPLAYHYQAPILLAQGSGLREATINEINRLGATEAIILGGEVAISNEVEESLKELGLSTRRLAGDNRFETAEAIADELLEFTPSDTAVLVDGFEFADAMSIAPIAAQEGMPIYLTRTNSLSTDDLSTYDSTYIIGGENAVSSTVANQLNNVRRLAGDNRYETNVEVLDYFDVDSNHLFIATGLDFVDALTGSVLAANGSTGVGLVRRDVNNDLKNYFDNQFFDSFTILGGEVAVPNTVYSTLSDYLESKEIKNETVLENETPFETIERENEELPLGETQVVQEGQEGYDEVTYSITYTNGVETARKEVSRVTVEPIEEIIEVGTKVIEIENIDILQDEVSLYEEESLQLDIEVSPDNATYPDVYWSSSDDSIASVTQEGLVSAHKEGTVEISVFNESKSVLTSIIVTVLKPTIVGVEDLTFTITEGQTFYFPEKVNVTLSNGLEKEVEALWDLEELSHHVLGVSTFEGVIPEYEYEIELTLIVNEFVPNILTRSYSQITFNNMTQALSLSIYNREAYEAQIDKIELYENDSLYTTYTAERLERDGINSIIEPGDDWGISITFRLGMFLDNSYVKYHLTINDRQFVFTDNLD